ncbi:unnamed protein product [Rotaria sp. Silwood1]|nr:unnamed protein product [Rotaria sp. Silwood1]CAF1620626.1 unnamed protein product [Rotaria sp. Silwood1]CAF3845087.1 unnamed protein product [Rotaria sp. Silwood1]CAF3875970.1 unnamed protein product [Rotaria sp. Silwood1]CAF4730675.1 unnamed protein product [Rotaria sp. Silwood1]
MNIPLQFHPVHGEHIKLSRNNTVAKRIDSFCKGICFSNRTIQIREKVYVRLLSKSIQWTGFLRLGVTTCDPNAHRTSTALPRHACPDLTCRPGYWAKCVPENCFDVANKLTYFYVDENGELFLNTPTGEISLLTGIFVQEPLWALLDIYGNCISIELVDDHLKRTVSLNDQLRHINTTVTTTFFKDISNDLSPLTFLPVHSSSISFFLSPSNTLPNQSIVLYDNTKTCDGLVFFSEPLTISSGLLIQILSITPLNESRIPTTTTSAISNLLPSYIQFGLTNCNTQNLLRTNDLPLDIEKINDRSEFWILQDFKLGNKTTIDRGDEFLFTFNHDGIIEYSHNNSKLKDFIHVDSNLIYYPFLAFKGDIVAVRSLGYIKNLDRYYSLQQINNTMKTNQELTSTDNNNIKNEYDVKLSQDCTICLDHFRDTVLIPCGHICLCYSCAKELIEHGTKQCPICRSSIKLINKIYLA